MSFMTGLLSDFFLAGAGAGLALLAGAVRRRRREEGTEEGGVDVVDHRVVGAVREKAAIAPRRCCSRGLIGRPGCWNFTGIGTEIVTDSA